jgi:hypothetical protein
MAWLPHWGVSQAHYLILAHQLSQWLSTFGAEARRGSASRRGGAGGRGLCEGLNRGDEQRLQQ